MPTRPPLLLTPNPPQPSIWSTGRNAQWSDVLHAWAGCDRYTRLDSDHIHDWGVLVMHRRVQLPDRQMPLMQNHEVPKPTSILSQVVT